MAGQSHPMDTAGRRSDTISSPSREDLELTHGTTFKERLTCYEYTNGESTGELARAVPG